MKPALPVHDLRRLLECFAADAVESGVGAFVEIVGIALEDPHDQFLHASLVRRRGRADELVAGHGQPVPRRFEPASDAIDEGLWCDPVGRRRLRHLLAVLVHAHEEPDVVTAEDGDNGDAVGSHLLEGMAEVRVAVGVVDGSGKEERRHSAAGPLGLVFLRQRRLHPAGGDGGAASWAREQLRQGRWPRVRRRWVRTVLKPLAPLAAPGAAVVPLGSGPRASAGVPAAGARRAPGGSGTRDARPAWREVPRSPRLRSRPPSPRATPRVRWCATRRRRAGRPAPGRCRPRSPSRCRAGSRPSCPRAESASAR